jgi:hypothetical protein
MIGDMPNASVKAYDLEDVVNALLAAAVSISQSMGLLHELSAQSPMAGEFTARARLTDAITLLAVAREGLIGDADRLSGVASGS